MLPEERLINGLTIVKANLDQNVLKPARVAHAQESTRQVQPDATKVLLLLHRFGSMPSRLQMERVAAGEGSVYVKQNAFYPAEVWNVTVLHYSFCWRCLHVRSLP